MSLEIGQVNGPLRVLAGPGTGKTRALVDLYAGAIKGGLATRGQILVLTFSTAAADEIERRLDEQLPDSYAEDWVSTFHSFCWRLLRDNRPDPRRLLLSGFQEWLVMRRTLAEIDDGSLGELEPVRRSDAFAQDALRFVALMKQNLVHPASLSLAAESSGSKRLQALSAVMSKYQSRLSEAHLVDFRDLVADAISLLGSSSDLLQELRHRFRYILVDEFQDVDPAQFYLLRLIAPPEARPNLVVAGDPDQAIYGFRGTLPGILTTDFVAAYGGSTHTLDLCHRCPPKVLESAERLLAATQPGRTPLALRSERPDVPSLVAIREADAQDEAFAVAREIRKLMIESGGRLRPKDFAILLRSTTNLSAPFEEALRALELPYEVRGLGALARNEVVRYLCAFLAALLDTEDEAAIDRLLASSLSGVDARTLGRLRAQAHADGRPLPRVVRHLMHLLDEAAQLPEHLAPLQPQELESLQTAIAVFRRLSAAAKELPLTALAYRALVDAGIFASLLRDPDPEVLEDLRAALAAFEELEAVHERLTGTPPLLADVGPSLNRLLARAIDDADPATGSKDAVQILTVHQSKGLEFEVVFCSGFAHGLMPLGPRADPLLEESDRRMLERGLDGFRPPWPADVAAHTAEEARLAYVGMTRARSHLYLTWADTYDAPAGPSAFLEPVMQGVQPLQFTREATVPAVADLLTRTEAETLLALARPMLDQRTTERVTAAGLDAGFITDDQAGRPFRPFGGGRDPQDVQPGHFSATALNDYIKCPRLYWYNQHPGLIPPEKTDAMERGGFLHRVLEDFHRNESEWHDLPADAQRDWLEKSLQVHLEGYLSRIEANLDRQREERAVRSVLDNYINFATTPGPIPRVRTRAVEMRFTLQLNGAEIRGVIDRVNDLKDGRSEVVDYKTGRGKSTNKAYEAYFSEEMSDVQLAVYYLACRDGLDEEGRPLNLDPRFLSVWYPKDWTYGSIRQVLFNLGEDAGLRWREHPLRTEDLERGRGVVVNAVHGILNGDFAPNPRSGVAGTCLSFTGCPHQMICPFGGGGE